MHYSKLALLASFVFLGTGCHTTSNIDSSTVNQTVAPAPLAPPVLVGGDRDAHGCIASAGFQWCEKQNQCVQAWMLPQIPNEGQTIKERVKFHCAK